MGSFKRSAEGHRGGFVNAWVAQSVERLSLVFGRLWSHACEIEPHIGLFCEESASDSPSFSLSLQLLLSLSNINKVLKKRERSTVIMLYMCTLEVKNCTESKPLNFHKLLYEYVHGSYIRRDMFIFIKIFRIF